MSAHPPTPEFSNQPVGVEVCQGKDLTKLNEAIISHGNWHRKRFEAQQEG
jgi:hypothetical protein